MKYVITNNGQQAKKDFPKCQIVETHDEACSLRKGSLVIVKRYTVGAARMDACSAADALIQKGFYQEVFSD